MAFPLVRRRRSAAAPSQTVAAPSAVPRHVAIIMDGNGRWAKARALPRVMGHRAGAEALRRTLEASIRTGVEWLTIYAFSSENWRRSAEEIGDLTTLLAHYLEKEVPALRAEGIRLRFLGDVERFGPAMRRDLAAAETLTAGNTRLNLNVALSYGGRAEIVAAARRFAGNAMAGRTTPDDLTEDAFAALLGSAGQPDPDLVIRTGGEQRLSNFLLWQSAYAELVFLPCLWPDFGADQLAAAIAEYAGRERRFGARPS